MPEQEFVFWILVLLLVIGIITLLRWCVYCACSTLRSLRRRPAAKFPFLTKSESEIVFQRQPSRTLNASKVVKKRT